MSRRYILVWALVAIIAAAFLSPFFISAVRTVFLFPSKVITGTARGVSGFFSFLARASKSETENAGLKKRVFELETETALQKASISEFERISKYRGYSYKFTVCRIISREPTNWFNTLVIDAGLDEGVCPGKPVLLPQGVVGRIIRADRSSSVVLLAVDNSSNISAITALTRELGIVDGTGQGLEMKFFTNSVGVRQGEAVLTSGQGGVFPKGLEIGRISEIKRSGLVAVAEIAPSVEFNKLEEVLVAK